MIVQAQIFYANIRKFTQNIFILNLKWRSIFTDGKIKFYFCDIELVQKSATRSKKLVVGSIRRFMAMSQRTAIQPLQ